MGQISFVGNRPPVELEARNPKTTINCTTFSKDISDSWLSKDYKWMESVADTAIQDQNQKPGGTAAPNCSVKHPTTPVSPPYWQHQRSISHASVDSDARAPPISLEDHTEAQDDASGGLWAKDITIEDYVIVRGGSTGVGAYVVWNCRVQTLEVRLGDSKCGEKAVADVSLKGGRMMIRKRFGNTGTLNNKCSFAIRYSEFNELREQLIAAFPHAKTALPPLPPKSIIC